MLYDAILEMPQLRLINPLINWVNLTVTPTQPLNREMLLNPKLKDLVNHQPLNFANLDREYLTEGDNKIEDLKEYLKRCVKSKIKLSFTGVASLNTKTTKLLARYANHVDIFNPEGSKRLPKY